jgi:ribosomal protein S18 acetylase RimI-like enzyme
VQIKPMSPVNTVGEVLDAVRRIKTGATGFCTNLFPSPQKLQSWVDHHELFSEPRDGATFFFKKDRDFWHLYFCAADLPGLRQAMNLVPQITTEPVVADLVGVDAALGELLPSLETAGFRRYARLQRMSRAGTGDEAGRAVDDPTVFAEKHDSPAVLELIESLFDRYGEQLPMPYEIESAVDNHQVVAVKRDDTVAGILFFETQGLASAVRFWAVAEKFQSSGVGSALMRRYLQVHSDVRRFTLWVNANNQNAIRKYEHYRYAPDGLVDCILANGLIHP